LKIVFRHILLFFKNAVWALTSGGFRIVSDILVYIPRARAGTVRKAKEMLSPVSNFTISKIPRSSVV